MAAELTPPPYLSATVAYLQERERAVWDWYGSAEAEADQTAAIRLELLKSTVRLEPATHGSLYDAAAKVCAALRLDVPVTFYQSIGRFDANASLIWLPGEAHIVVHGDILDVLGEREREAMIAHELGHGHLCRERDGAYHRAGRILADMAADAAADVSVQRSDAIFRQHCEIYCDRAALAVVGDLEPVVGCLVKLKTGLKTIDPSAYVRQADEIFGMERPTTQGLTHPEIYIRVRALAGWQRGAPGVDAEIEGMLTGPLQIDQPALLDRVRLENLTRDVLALLLQPPFMRSEIIQAHARLFFDGADADQPPPPDLIDRLARELPAAHSSVHDYVGYVLLDFVAADPTIGDEALAHALSMAEKLGIRPRFEEKVTKELKVNRKRLATLRAEARPATRPDSESAP